MKTFSIPFRFSEGSVASNNNVDIAVKAQIIDYLMTNFGERVMRSNYGGNIQRLAFELNDPLVLADYKVDSIPEINSYLSRGRVLDIAVLDHPTNPQSSPYGDNVATIAVRYATSPRNISTLRLVVRSQLTSESDF
jgi:phage baseplate assembly protein W